MKSGLGRGSLFACAALVGVSLVMAGPACGGDNSQMRVTLTDHGCTYGGNTTAAAGRFTIDVENQSHLGASFALKKLAKGFTSDTIAPTLSKERAWIRSLTKADLSKIERGQPLIHPRPDLPQIFMDPQHSTATEIGAGARSVLPADATAGNYAVLCRIGGLSPSATISDLRAYNVYVASQIKVTGTPSYLK